ncbi:proline dehydrogenase family protein [Alicyclobacillus vulcanalis]|uniref:proline dehydrogenase n=1 Tax=Alicyclobacillus vulcanalis TaxID=252246 RepID=A0A1N7JQV4_9BACL|nr:proline dehydrogenase family protein [Alicyclobacillus vulcanalis]SIS51687.1 L-proline dehydrogenase [Alicyclobacillus vulcanalis]
MEQLMRNTLLKLSRSRRAEHLARRFGFRLGAGRFVPGESLEDAVRAVEELHRRGLAATLDHLGEFVDRPEEARQAADFCVRTLERFAGLPYDLYLSVKLTQLGLDIDEGLCMENMHRIVARARDTGRFVRIDMEDYAHNEVTLTIYRKLLAEFGTEHIGTVIQAYLYKSADDIRALAPLRPNLRLVKGAYKESPSVAYPEKRDVDENYKRVIDLQLQSGGRTAVATHDEAIIAWVKERVRELNIPQARWEFQMLYGIRPQLQESLAREGYKVRVYVPFGEDWYGYFMRRLAERPANVGFVLKSLVKS